MGYLFRGYVGERVSSLMNPGWRGGVRQPGGLRGGRLGG